MSEEILFHCVIPGRPGIKKNGKKICRNRKTGRVFLKSSDKYDQWALVASHVIKQAMAVKNIDYPVNACMRFYFKNHAHESDLSNNYQGVEDILESVGVLENDKLIYSHDGSRKIFNDTNERCEITITRLKD